MSTSPKRIAAWDKQHVWHPFTPMGEYIEGDPIIIERGKGVQLQDTEGRWYYDGVSSVWLNVHGHGAEPINEAVRQQLDKVAHSTTLGQGNVPSTRLAKRLVEAGPPDLNRVFYSDSGATAVEIALKMAVQYWANQGREQKRYVMGFTNNYHGDTIGAMGVAPDDVFHWPFLYMLPDHPRVPYPYPYRCEFDSATKKQCLQQCLKHLEQQLKQREDELAALIVEPVEGAGGMIVPPEGFLCGLRKLCNQYEVLLIVDEVATGFGRTGPLFACGAENITPDILCLGKGITGGYLPVAATMATEAIFEKFLGGRKKALLHGHSYTGNQLGCAAALASLDLLEDLLPELPPKITYINERLSAFKELPFVGNVRQRGFMCGIELVADTDTKRLFPAEAQVGYRVSDAARERGMLIRPLGRNVIFMPPLAASREELAEMLDILYASFQAVEDQLQALAKEPA